MKRVEIVLAAALVAVSGPTPFASESVRGIGWEKDLVIASKRATASEQPIMVDVAAVWCVPCKQMDETTHRDPRVVDAAAALVPVRVDADAQPTFTERYGVEAFPTILFLDANGEEITRRTGYQSAQDLLRTMQQITRGYGAYAVALKKKDDPEALGTAASYLLEAGNAQRSATLLKRALKGLPAGARRDQAAFMLAEAQLALGDARPAAQTFEKLYNESADEALRGRALKGLVLALRKRGSPENAERALAMLRERYPDLASDVD